MHPLVVFNLDLPNASVIITHHEQSASLLHLRCEIALNINATVSITTVWYKNEEFLASEDNNTQTFENTSVVSQAEIVVPLRTSEAGVYKCAVSVDLPALNIGINSSAETNVIVTSEYNQANMYCGEHCWFL